MGKRLSSPIYRIILSHISDYPLSYIGLSSPIYRIILSDISDWIQVVQAICMAKVEIKNLTVLLYFRWRGGSTLLRELGWPHLHSQNMCAGKQIFDHHIIKLIWKATCIFKLIWKTTVQYVSQSDLVTILYLYEELSQITMKHYLL